MRILQGTPKELSEFLENERRGEFPENERSVEFPESEQSADDQSRTIPAEIERFVRERARDADTYRRVIDSLTRVKKLGTDFVPGTSKTRKSGHTNYIRVHPNGPRLRSSASSAVAYVKPRLGVMDLRLLPQDVADINDPRVEVLRRGATRPYQVRFHLSDDTAPDLAYDLTARALAKLRP